MGSAAHGAARPAAPIGEVARTLAVEFPEATTALDHRSAFELVVATALSAQTTDERVNVATAELFARWPDPASLAAAPAAEVEAVIRPVGLAPTKSRRVIALAGDLLGRFDGDVPRTQAELETLPGVGRKTALVVRGVWFGDDALAVDTHVARLARRLGWTSATDPVRVEDDVVARADAAREEDPGALPGGLTALSLRLILHGRATCRARRAACERCALAEVCPSAGEEAA